MSRHCAERGQWQMPDHPELLRPLLLGPKRPHRHVQRIVGVEGPGLPLGVEVFFSGGLVVACDGWGAKIRVHDVLKLRVLRGQDVLRSCARHLVSRSLSDVVLGGRAKALPARRDLSDVLSSWTEQTNYEHERLTRLRAALGPGATCRWVPGGRGCCGRDA